MQRQENAKIAEKAAELVRVWIPTLRIFLPEVTGRTDRSFPAPRTPSPPRQDYLDFSTDLMGSPLLPGWAGATVGSTSRGKPGRECRALRPAERSTGAPSFLSDSDDASRIWTTSRPLVPLVNGETFSRMQLRKCWHSVFSGSSCLMYGLYMSP